MKRAIKQLVKAMGWLTPAPVWRGRGRTLVPILRYHSLDDSGSCVSTTIEAWSRHLTFFQEEDLQVVSLREFFAAAPSEGKETVVMTFDDGYKNNFERAFRDLQRLNYSATFFVVPQCVGGKAAWVERDLRRLLSDGEAYLDDPWETFTQKARVNWEAVRKYLPQMLRFREARLLLEFYHLNKIKNLPLMSWQDILQMSRSGMDIGAHTLTHCHLCDLNERETWNEIEGSKTVIEGRTGIQVQQFCYPYGDVPDGAAEVVEGAGYRAACGCEVGFQKREENRFSLRRIAMEKVTTARDIDFLLNARHRAFLHGLTSLRRLCWSG